MEYVQMTLTDWMEIKQKLKMELQGVKQSFVRIGYLLRKIDDQKAYESDGYKSIAEFAKEEYGLEASTVSRFMSINREYSIDGYSEHLREEYLEMGRSQLEEMLKLPEQDRTMIRPESSREDIRDLKRFNRTEPEQGVADDHRELIQQFFETNTDTVKELSYSGAYAAGDIEKMIEIVNPSGNKSFRKGLYFMMMYEDNIKIKKYGGNPETMSWDEFFGMAREIIEKMEVEKAAQLGKTPSKTGFAEAEKTVEIESKIEENDSKDGEKEEKQPDKIMNEPEIEKKQEKPLEKTSEKPIAPAQKTAKTPSKTDISLQEKMEEMTVKKEPEPEKTMRRKDYIDGLTEYGAAEYIGKFVRTLGEDLCVLRGNSLWQQWLSTEVNENGYEIIDEEE